MVSFKIVEIVISWISLFAAYIVSVTLSGSFKSWAASYSGDNTSEDMGLLSFNPFVHIDPVGMILLFLFGFGWGRFVPINPFNIYEPFKTLKLFFVYLADCAVYFLLTGISLFILIYIFGLKVFVATSGMMLSGALSFPNLVRTFQDFSSLSLVAMFILVFSVYLNTLLGVIFTIFNTFNCLAHILYGDSLRFSGKYFLYYVVIPLVILFLFADLLRSQILILITRIAYFMAVLCGGS